MQRLSWTLILVLAYSFLGVTWSQAFEAKEVAIAHKYIAQKSKELSWPSITPRKFAELLVMGKKVAFVDVRSPMETAIWYPKSDKVMDSFIIPLQEIPSTIQRIHPEQYDFVILSCPTGPRAATGATLARLMGFDNVYFLRGGNKALGALTGTFFRKTARRLLKAGKIKEWPKWME